MNRKEVNVKRGGDSLHMKKGWIILFLMLFIVGGCSTGSESYLAKNDLVIFGRGSDIKIGIGMERSEVDHALGTPVVDPNNIIHDYNGVQVGYRENKVVGIVLQADSGDLFTTRRGIRIGSTKSALIRAYGTFLRDEDFEEHAQHISIIIEEKNGTFEVLGPNGIINHENEKKLYMLAFALHSKKVESISILDYVFATRLK